MYFCFVFCGIKVFVWREKRYRNWGFGVLLKIYVVGGGIRRCFYFWERGGNIEGLEMLLREG